MKFHIDPLKFSVSTPKSPQTWHVTVEWQHLDGWRRRTTYRREFDAQLVRVRNDVLVITTVEGLEAHIPFSEITEYRCPAEWPDTGQEGEEEDDD